MRPNQKLNIVFWSFASWNDEYVKSTIELAKELAVRHNVLYIDYSYTIKDILTQKGENVPVGNILGKENGLRNISLSNGAQISLLSLPPVIPFNWISNKNLFSVIEKLNGFSISRRIKTALNKINYRPDVIVNAFNPYFDTTSRKIFEKLPNVYYCYDNIDATNWAKKHGTRLEKNVIKTADAVIFSSDALQQNKEWNKKSFVIRNGVDIKIFEKLSNKARNNERKIIGYTGCIDNRLDYNLLEDLITRNPLFDFLFVGPIKDTNAQTLKRFNNVKFTGPVKPEHLPQAMQQFDAGIIPFVKNDFTRNIYPMKANEYLALGIPVITTDFAEMKDLSNHIEIAYSKGEFSSKLQHSLATDSESKRQERKLKASGNSWEHKSLEFEKVLSNVIE